MNYSSHFDWMSGLPVYFPADTIGLPTNGFTVYGLDCIGNHATKVTSYYSMRGVIHPVDKNAPDIEFQVNMPASWNGVAIQYGGQGFDGAVELATGTCAGQNYVGISPVLRGYVTFGSDGGHKGRPGTNWDASFGLNDEALRNFATESLKKTKDAALAIAAKVYGVSPEKVYFAGTSNGGREALKAIHDYPEDYDGAVIQYPVLNWIGKAIIDNRNTNYICENKNRWISREDYQKIREIIASHICKPDSHGTMIPVPFPSEEVKKQIISEISAVLSEEQLKAFLLFGESMDLPYELDNGITHIPGYGILEGVILQDMYFSQLSSEPQSRDGFMSQFSDEVIRFHIMRDANFDPAAFDPVVHQEKVLTASRLLEATSPNFDRFVERGGKIILLHGTSDQLVTIYSTIGLVKKMSERYGEKLNDFLRFYLVPGYGHGIGEDFTLCRDLMADLEGWVATGIAPEELDIEDQTPDHDPRKQTLHPFHVENTAI